MLVRNARLQRFWFSKYGKGSETYIFSKHPIIHISISCRWSVENIFRNIAKQITYDKSKAFIYSNV